MEQEQPTNRLPGKCHDCAKSCKPFIHGKCNFCQELGFQESVFCELNRFIQDPASFECYAFQPILKLVRSSKHNVSTFPESPQDRSKKNALQKIFESEKMKYQRALILQKMTREPDSVFSEIKYHFAWNVFSRKPVFEQPKHMIDFIRDTFSNCSELVGGFVSLLWLAPDHVHLYVESDGENSVETIAQEIKRLSSSPIIVKFADLKVNLNREKHLWDKSYFVETVG